MPVDVYYPSGGPTSFGLTDETDPQYYIAWCSFVISENIRKMEEAGFQWTDEGEGNITTVLWSRQNTALTQQSAYFQEIRAKVSAKGALLLDRLRDENSSLADLDRTQQNYRLRATAITQHAQIASALLLSTGETVPPAEKDPKAIEQDQKTLQSAWDAQSAVLDQQSTYLKDVKSLFNAKHKNLPKNFSVANFLKSSYFEWVVAAILKLIPGEFDDVLAKDVLVFVGAIIGEAIELLELFYTAGGTLCDKMRAENTELKNMTASWDAYTLRSQVLTQHDQSMQTLLAQIAQAENQVLHAQSGVSEEKSLINVLEEMSANILHLAVNPIIVETFDDGQFIDIWVKDNAIDY